MSLRYSIVIPTIGRPSLRVLLESLAVQQTGPDHPGPREIILVDDRTGPVPPLPESLQESLPGAGWPVRVVRDYGRGPGSARNRGWRVARDVEWIAFLDDDIVLPEGWLAALVEDLRACADNVAASQAWIRVPLPRDRRPTDWERNVAGLEHARWATADMAYRRRALEQVHGFDERFPRAFREDADLALRVEQAGWTLRRGDRHIIHPVRPADDGVSVRLQAGNSDDALMRRLHGRDWYARAGAPRGAFGWHAATVTAAVLSGTALTGTALIGTRRGLVTGLTAAGLWAGLTGRFLGRRLAPGPRPGDPEYATELRRMTTTSLAIPFAAVGHRLRGHWRHRKAEPWPPPPLAILFDRDGTLIRDVSYNGDPDKAEAMPGAVAAVARARAAGLRIGVVSNQSGIARGLLTETQVREVNARVDDLFGGFDTWQFCPHGPDDGCDCRKPAPGLVQRAATALGVDVRRCIVIGDIGADVEAAQAAGATPVLVPTDITREDEIADAPRVAPDLLTAVEQVIP